MWTAANSRDASLFFPLRSCCELSAVSVRRSASVIRTEAPCASGFGHRAQNIFFTDKQRP
jgi:hypothetical protein